MTGESPPADVPLPKFRRLLLAWFDAAQRELPWRTSRDPYAIWVSEVMLQQTTVQAVVPFFERFLSRFPTLAVLASASLDEVLQYWAGLGYYRRARHLHAAAQKLVERGYATFPDDPVVAASLPGVGDYILGAVLSQAYDRRVPIVEANILRVLPRLFAYPGDPRSGAGKKWIWAAAAEILPQKRVGDFNQALMELGALLCTPTHPHCDDCPVNALCQARQRGLQASIPPPSIKKSVETVHEAGFVLIRAQKVLLCRRRDTAIRWARMWEFPHLEIDDAARLVPLVTQLTGLSVSGLSPVTVVRHRVTRFDIHLQFHAGPVQGGVFQSDLYDEHAWVTVPELAGFAVSSPQRKFMRSGGIERLLGN